ncbi:hypothetical protein BGZ82_002780, partial [Podila clonocystis]
MVFAGLYDMVFSFAKDNLYFTFVGICFHLPFPDIALISTSVIAITYGGQLRALGIASLVVFAVVSFPLFNKPYHDETSTYIAGPITIKYTILYPIVLACFITIIVKDHDQWIPRPQTKLEQFLLAAKIISGSPSDGNEDGLEDLETGIFWWGLKISSFQDHDGFGSSANQLWSQAGFAPPMFTESQPLSDFN